MVQPFPAKQEHRATSAVRCLPRSVRMWRGSLPTSIGSRPTLLARWNTPRSIARGRSAPGEVTAVRQASLGQSERGVQFLSHARDRIHRADSILESNNRVVSRIGADAVQQSKAAELYVRALRADAPLQRPPG